MSTDTYEGSAWSGRHPVNMIGQIRWFPAYPLWSLVAIGLGIAVLYALTAGWKAARRDLRSRGAPAASTPASVRRDRFTTDSGQRTGETPQPRCDQRDPWGGVPSGGAPLRRAAVRHPISSATTPTTRARRAQPARRPGWTQLADVMGPGLGREEPPFIRRGL